MHVTRTHQLPECRWDEVVLVKQAVHRRTRYVRFRSSAGHVALGALQQVPEIIPLEPAQLLLALIEKAGTIFSRSGARASDVFILKIGLSREAYYETLCRLADAVEVVPR